LKESTLEVIREKVEFSMRAVESFKDGAKRNWSDENFRHIYEGLASIFEGYALCFEFILKEEGVQESCTRRYQPDGVVVSTGSRVREAVPQADRRRA